MSTISNPPKLTFITVTKIMNDRFVVDDNRNGFQNPKGIVVGD